MRFIVVSPVAVIVMSIDCWVIYDHPKDYPDHFVARRFMHDRPTPDIRLSESLEELRLWMRKRRLMCFHRAIEDDPKIVETWL